MTRSRSVHRLGPGRLLRAHRDAEQPASRRLLSGAALAALAGVILGAFAQPAAAKGTGRLEKDKLFSVRTLACDEARQVRQIILHVKQGDKKSAEAALLIYRQTRNKYNRPACDVGIVQAVPVKVVETIPEVTIGGITQDKYIVQMMDPRTGYVFYILSIHSFRGEAARYRSI